MGRTTYWQSGTRILGCSLHMEAAMGVGVWGANSRRINQCQKKKKFLSFDIIAMQGRLNIIWQFGLDGEISSVNNIQIYAGFGVAEFISDITKEHFELCEYNRKWQKNKKIVSLEWRNAWENNSLCLIEVPRLHYIIHPFSIPTYSYWGSHACQAQHAPGRETAWLPAHHRDNT